MTNPRNINLIQSRIKVITTEQELMLNKSHSINQAWPLIKQVNDISTQPIAATNRKNILDKYIGTANNTV